MTVLWSAGTAFAADARFEHSNTGIEIKGDGWSLKYGSSAFVTALWFPIEGQRAYFSHGRWLRLIDTEKGLVIGRWDFPGEITRIEKKDKVEIEVKAEEPRNSDYRRTFSFDPNAPNLPYWPTGSVQLAYLGRLEVDTLAESLGFSEKTNPGYLRIKPDPKMISVLEETIRRDPLSPWFQVALGRLLRRVGDARAADLFNSALRVPTTDFTELLPLSYLLAQFGESDFSRAFYERGFRDFWERGNDPRLVTNLVSRLIYFGAIRPNTPISADQRRELIERFYRGGPYNEGSDLAWAAYANELEKSGNAKEALEWRQRARDAMGSGHIFEPYAVGILPMVVSLPLGISVSVVLYILLCCIRYRRQRRLDLSTRGPGGRIGRAFFLFNVEYWTRKQRLAFLMAALLCWIGFGLARSFALGAIRGAGIPVSLGSGLLAGPDVLWYLGNKTPSTPERDLLLALAHQQTGDVEEAERMYRRLPQFAVSWNNLGVLLKTSGRGEESRQAFERALSLNPDLAEAALNLGRAPGSLWTVLHQQYVPARPMLAPPRIDIFEAAFRGGSLWAVALRSWAGPFVGWSEIGQEMDFYLMPPSTKITTVVVVVFLTFGLALVLIIPSRDVTERSGKAQLATDILFPGISPAWNIFGGLALSAWCYILLAYWLIRIKSNLFYVFFDLSNAYGVPANFSKYMEALRLWWIWLYALGSVLFAVNLVLVLRRWKAERPSVSVG